MTRKNPPAKWSLPLVIDPPKKLCFTIEVPDDPYHIAAFRGALLALAAGYNWQDDPEHLAREVALVWRAIVDDVLPCVDCPDNIVVDEWEDELAICESLRFQDGKLQGLCCGEWTDIEGQDGRELGGPLQEGGGAPQPAAGGGCQTYHAIFDAKSQYLVPTIVSAGDEITFSNAQGAGQDGSISPWACPDGRTFFKGECVGVAGLQGGDPAAAQNHMALVANIGGTWYAASSGTITVPGGVTNAQITIQVNDDPLADNSGSYALDIEVCNNATVMWTSTMEFAVSPYDFVNVPADDGGAWMPGDGWNSTQVVLGDGNCYEGVAIRKDFAAANLTSIHVDSILALGTGGGIFSLELVKYTPARVSLASTPNANGAVGVTYSTPGSFTNFEINVAVGTTTGPCGTPPGGNALLVRCVVTGPGTKPPEFP